MDPAVLDSISDVGLGALLIGVLIGGWRGWWIFGPIHKSIMDDKDEQIHFWREQALRGTALSERAVDVAAHDDARHT